MLCVKLLPKKTPMLCVQFLPKKATPPPPPVRRYKLSHEKVPSMLSVKFVPIKAPMLWVKFVPKKAPLLDVKLSHKKVPPHVKR